jgi:hypothetical protein
MLFLLIFSFYSEFEWVEAKEPNIKAVAEKIMGSSMVESYGENNIERRLIYLTSGIFRGGSKVLFLKGSEIMGLPKGLRLMKRAIKMKKFDRYCAFYEKGELKQAWEDLEKESARKLGISSLSLEELKKILPNEDYNERLESTGERMPKIKYKVKTYYSFIEIKEGGTIKLIPVIIHLCPIAEKIEEYMNNLIPKGD